MRFNSRKDRWVYILIFGSIAVMVIPVLPLLSEGFSLTAALLTLFVLSISALLLWLIYGTYYFIEEGFVKYRSGPLKGEIPIDSIHTLEKGKTLWVGYRPATATKGVIIRYNKYDEIYFSPDSNDQFVEELLKKKPEIKVVEP